MDHLHSVELKFFFPGLCGFLMGVFNLSVSSDLYVRLVTSMNSILFRPLYISCINLKRTNIPSSLKTT